LQGGIDRTGFSPNGPDPWVFGIRISWKARLNISPIPT
jgi:hypothetical protein